MKIGIISDTHFGDKRSILSDPKNQYYQALFNALSSSLQKGEKFEYFIMLGDVLDLAVSNYYDAINAAKPFFSDISQLVNKIIIIPGNHDHDLWTMLQFQKQIVNLKANVRNLWTTPTFIKNTKGQLSITSSGKEQSFHTETFLDDIFAPNKFIIAAPNLYLFDEDKSILLTHGQYFEFAWAFLYDGVERAFGDTLLNTVLPLTPLQHTLGDNFLTNQVTCSGLGQSEVNLVNIIQSLEHDFKDGNYLPIIVAILNFIFSFISEKDANKFVEEIQKNKYRISVFLKSIISSIIFTTREGNSLDQFEEQFKNEFQKSVTSKFAIASSKVASDFLSPIWKILEIDELIHYNKDLIATTDDEDKNAIWIERYINASNGEAYASDSNDSGQKLQYMIYGHTHHPVTWNQPDSSINPIPSNTNGIANCGGWLNNNEQGTTVCGAELFIYDSQTKKITDISIP